MKHFYELDLQYYNSFHLHSIANDIWIPETLEDLTEVFYKLRNKKYNILAGGTNVLLKERLNTVIYLKHMIPIINWKGKLVYCSAFSSTLTFINEVIKNNFTGVEGLIGIPGTLGGAIVMNAGSGNYSISDYSHTILAITPKGKIKIYDKEDLQFKRRYSILQDTKEIVIGGLFRFRKKGINKKIIDKTNYYRSQFPKGYSAGGIFKNWHVLKPYEKNLIGLSVGDAMVSKNVNVIINKGNATYQDIMTLIQKIKDIVKIPLELEIKIME